MSPIRELLTTGKSARDQDAKPVTEEELLQVEKGLPFALPQSYREFVALGGLAELRIYHRALSPAEIATTIPGVGRDCIPFADNGCGDLYCWRASTGAEPAVFFFDHESSDLVPHADSFTDWLRANRF